MSMPELAVVAGGSLPTGERWIVTAGGSANDYYTFLETAYPDGGSDEGGFGGPALYPGRLLNGYTGIGTRGLRRVLARADARVRRLRVELAAGGPVELAPAGRRAGIDLVFFATLLPPTTVITALVGLDANGSPVR